LSLSPNEIRKRATKFSHDWKDASDEKAESQSFWNDFFSVFGIERRRVATFEKRVEKLGGTQGYIDVFWPGNMIAEHKTKGKNLDSALLQAMDYTDKLEENELPKYILVSDFENMRVYDLLHNTDKIIKMEKLSENIELFNFISGHIKQTYEEDIPLNRTAAELMGKLHDTLRDNGYIGHDLELLLVRLLFCLFADDTGIFTEKDDFRFFIENKTKIDGSDIGTHLLELFEVLNTAEDKRQKNLDEDLNKFPYINGKLFEERISTPAFDTNGRKILLTCCTFDWGQVSPAIFGAMFQSVMDKEKRREIGAHYTSEKNIMKIVKSLFIDELRNEFESIKAKEKLKTLLDKIKKLKLLDPACGCGNFLILSYRELRLLEIDIHKKLFELEKRTSRVIDVSEFDGINVDSMYGIEIEEFPARIAEAALWLMDHIMNKKLQLEFGQYYVRIPLKTSPHIVVGNALRTDWNTIIDKNKLNYILGNPPFVGSKLRTPEQKDEMDFVFEGIKGGGELDYVTAWYKKAVDFIKETSIKVAFVSTNSITQGEQAGILFDWLFKNGVKIHFAHRTFKWTNEARGKAAVYVVIIGFALYDVKKKELFYYDNIKGNPIKIKAVNINGYLVDQRDIIILSRNKPISNVPEIVFGSMPNDNGNFLFTEEEKETFLKIEPKAKQFFRPLISAKEFLHNEKRYCLWLADATPSIIKALPEVEKRVEAVRKYRLESTREATRKLAKYPNCFGEIRQPDSDYIIIPRVSSENRHYIPMAIINKESIAGDTCCLIPENDKYILGLLSSEMHMTWVNQICGRLESRYRYSNELVYNNFPFPLQPSKVHKENVIDATETVLSARKKFKDTPLADLYNPTLTPKKLVDAHHRLDKAVDLCYRKQAFSGPLERLNFLFDLYLKYTEPLIAAGKFKSRKKS
jgi:type II restriction/modification system DNA methylase subunit YeeA